MDTEAFYHRVSEQFVADPHTSPPADPRWTEMIEDVAGFTGPNELAVLNLAARILPENESYLEVGSFKGRSICAAVQDNTAKTFYVMENFVEFGMQGPAARAELERNLARYAVDADVTLVEGDCFRLMAESSRISKPVGVYFYDGEHTLLAHYLALAAVQPLLADEALVLVDDATWPVVQRAHRLFLERHPDWSIEERWDAREDDDPLWANGLHALTFRRSPDASTVWSRTDRALIAYQTRLQGPLNSMVWRSADRIPEGVKSGIRSVLSRSRSVGG